MGTALRARTVTITAALQSPIGDLKMSGTQFSDFTDLGPEIIRRLLARKTATFEQVLREKWKCAPERSDEPLRGS
jgi:hypothetical protein